jgi:DNA-binding transcriptional regulator YhcF (GntR family)
MGSDFDHERLHYLREAVRLGSIRGAAERLNVNPSTVSRQIALLEHEVSSTLLERFGKGVRATEAGQLLVEYARIQNSAREDTLAKLADLKTLKSGHIELVTGEGYIGDLLGGPLQAGSFRTSLCRWRLRERMASSSRSSRGRRKSASPTSYPLTGGSTLTSSSDNRSAQSSTRNIHSPSLDENPRCRMWRAIQ